MTESTATTSPIGRNGWMSKVTDLYHIAAAGYYTARLAIKQKAVTNTYRYCHHLERLSFVDARYRQFLEKNPSTAQNLARAEFIDDVPDAEQFANFPAGTLGAEYCKISRDYRDGTLDYLRPLRLETLPHEKKGLEPLRGGASAEERLAWLMARRNIYMTTTHDLAHVMAGCDVSLEGEALVAMYQFHHLRVPQNFMNMWNARLGLSAAWKRAKIHRIRYAWNWVEKSTSPLALDWSKLWALPMPEARVQAGLPPEGLQLAPLPARR
jgi:ubiquinone biosynthesis protein Coq4